MGTNFQYAITTNYQVSRKFRIKIHILVYFGKASYKHAMNTTCFKNLTSLPMGKNEFHHGLRTPSKFFFQINFWLIEEIAKQQNKLRDILAEFQLTFCHCASLVLDFD